MVHAIQVLADPRKVYIPQNIILRYTPPHANHHRAAVCHWVTELHLFRGAYRYVGYYQVTRLHSVRIPRVVLYNNIMDVRM